MKASELLVKCLENEKVKYIFGLPGEENIDIMDALLDSEMRFILTRHEQGAAFMADVYGRLSGKAGVCLSTLGPGATNLMTGVADANMDRAPIVAITGQASLDRMHKESHQYIDIVGIFHPITKWNTQIKKPEVIPEAVRKAFKVAETERPGATHIDFAEKLNIPVAHTFMGKGALSDNNELSLFTVGLQAGDYIASGLARADVIITIGYDIVEYSPEKWNPNRDKKIVHIDMSPAEVDAHYIISVGVTGDISISLREIADRARQNEANYSKALREQILRECEAYKNDKSFPPKPLYPERKVVTVTGDGGFLMNSQELETAVREEVPFVSLVFHDKSYSLIEIKQQITFGRKSHVNFGNPDFVKFAESFGAIGYRIEAAGELKPVLEEAFSKNKPVIVDCPVDYRENLKIVEKFGGLLIFA